MTNWGIQFEFHSAPARAYCSQVGFTESHVIFRSKFCLDCLERPFLILFGTYARTVALPTFHTPWQSIFGMQKSPFSFAYPEISTNRSKAHEAIMIKYSFTALGSYISAVYNLDTLDSFAVDQQELRTNYQQNVAKVIREDEKQNTIPRQGRIPRSI